MVGTQHRPRGRAGLYQTRGGSADGFGKGLPVSWASGLLLVCAGPGCAMVCLPRGCRWLPKSKVVCVNPQGSATFGQARKLLRFHFSQMWIDLAPPPASLPRETSLNISFVASVSWSICQSLPTALLSHHLHAGGAKFPRLKQICCPEGVRERLSFAALHVPGWGEI